MLSRLETLFQPTPVQYLGEFNGVRVSIKREDLLHPGLSGNKFWKLKLPLFSYLTRKPKNPLLISFGGAWSNHLHACSFLGPLLDLPTLGVVRGEELGKRDVQNWSATLRDTKRNGMDLHFVSRPQYRDKEALYSIYKERFPDALLIPEGGNQAQGEDGIRGMLPPDLESYTHLAVAVGTGTTLRGIQRAAPDHQLLGYLAVKDASCIRRLHAPSTQLFDASQGGFGKINTSLVRFIQNFEDEYGIPLDPIYTGKMMSELWNQLRMGTFETGSHLLVFHTGGLQGRKSCPELSNF